MSSYIKKLVKKQTNVNKFDSNSNTTINYVRGKLILKDFSELELLCVASNLESNKVKDKTKFKVITG
jgi:hypothetical protein